MSRRGGALIAIAGLVVASAVAVVIAAKQPPMELPSARTSWDVPPPSLLPPAPPPLSPPESTFEFQRYLGRLFASEAFDTICHAERVETLAILDFALERDVALKPTPSDLPIPFTILPGATPVPPDIAREIARVVLDPAIYSDGVHGCLFQPGMAIRFWKGPRAVDAIVCFQCGDLGFQPVGTSGTILGKTVFERQPLLDLVRRARPADRRLARLRSEGPHTRGGHLNRDRRGPS